MARTRRERDLIGGYSGGHMQATVLPCGHCGRTMAVLFEPSVPGAPEHPYVFGCPWCGRLVRRPLAGVLMRVVRASPGETRGES